MSSRRFSALARAGALLAVIGAASPVAIPSTARAGEPTGAELEALRKRFYEGIDLEETESWDQALAAFQEVAAKRMSASVRFHIALCHEHLGHLATALDGYDEALAIAKGDPEKSKDVLEKAPGRVAALEGRVATIELVIADGSASIAIDDGAPKALKSGASVRLDAGKHRVLFVEGDKRELVTEITVSDGDRRKVEVPSRKKVEPSKGGTGVDPPKKEADVEPGNVVPGFVVGGVGIVSLVLSGVFIGLRQLSISEVRDSCTDGDSGCDPAVQDVAERGRAYEFAAWGLGGGGIALLGVGLALHFTIGQDSPKTPASGASQPVTFTVGPGRFAIAGTFD
ncbi:MAG: hypothetical protein U0271_05730 [Polyangiaceae bacterium]